MKRNFIKTVCVALCIFFNASFVWGQWEPTSFSQQAVWALCEAENGNLIAADDIYPERGGLYLSNDEGKSWEKCDVENFAYTSYVVKGEMVYFGGVDCTVAISPDHGETWSTSHFRDLFPGAVNEEPIYALEFSNDRLYVAVLGWGVVYSDDWGATWHLTDRKSLLDKDDPDNGGQWCYNLRFYKGKLYNLGAYGIWEYDEEKDLWTQIDDGWYASDSFILDDVLYVTYNAYGIPHAIRHTSDMKEWTVVPIPESISTSVRIVRPYNGALFLGHANDAVFYTLDKGETWIDFKEGFPGWSPVPDVVFYDCPMDFVFTYDKVFCGVFSTNAGSVGVHVAPLPEALVTAPSNDASLKNLAVDKGILTPEFNPETTQYELFFPTDDITSVFVTALPSYRKAQVEGAGLIQVGEESQTITISVTAEDKKTKKVYTIVTKRENVGVENPDLLVSTVYPNPSNGFVTIQLDKKPEAQASLLITDMLGRQRYAKILDMESREIAISTQDWASGLYIYTIINGKSKSGGKFIVK